MAVSMIYGNSFPRLANNHKICRTTSDPINKNPRSDADCGTPASINFEKSDVKRNSTPAGRVP